MSILSKLSPLLSWFQLSRLIDAVTVELLNFAIDTFESITDYKQQTTVCGGNLWVGSVPISSGIWSEMKAIIVSF